MRRSMVAAAVVAAIVYRRWWLKGRPVKSGLTAFASAADTVSRPAMAPALGKAIAVQERKGPSSRAGWRALGTGDHHDVCRSHRPTAPRRLADRDRGPAVVDCRMVERAGPRQAGEGVAAQRRARVAAAGSGLVGQRALAERGKFGEFLAGGIDVGALALEVVGDRTPQGRVGDERCRVRTGRQIAAGKLVLALGAGLDPRQPMRNGKLDRLVVADLEMQTGVVLDGAPIAPVETVATDQMQ